MNWPALTNPWMLAGLAAAGLPILIHYLTRARRKQVAFPPFQFLVEACAGQQALHRLRTFILLTLRCLLALALALLFARPFLRPEGAVAKSDAVKRTIVIVDASLSMRATQRGVTLYSRAKAEAADVLRGIESGGEAAVILSGATPRPLLPALSKNIPALHEALLKAEPTFEKGSPAAAFALAAKMLNGSDGVVFVFSDFQQSDWERAGELPQGVACRLRSVAAEIPQNVAITKIDLSPADPVVGDMVEAACAVFNSTAEPRKEKVKLELGGVVQEASVSVAPYKTAVATFNVSFPATGFFAGKATLVGADDLIEDNVRHVSARVQAGSQLLVISDSDEADRRSGAFFVTTALAPSTNSAPGLVIVRRHGQDVDRGALETADTFVLVAPAQLTGEAVEIIGRRVNEGAQAIVFLDGPTAPTLMPATFAPPFQLGVAVAGSGNGTLRLANRRVFRDPELEDWSGVRFSRHFQTTMLPGKAESALLVHEDGAAAVTMTSLGKGALVFVNLPVTPDGGELIGNPIFPAMLHELLRALRRGTDRAEFISGANLAVEAIPKTDAAIQVTAAGGTAIDAQTLSKGRTVRLAIANAGEPGPYTARQASDVVGVAVVNIDPAESDLRPIAVEKIKVGAGSVSILRGEGNLETTVKTRELWPALALAAALFLAIEMLLLAFWRTEATKPFTVEANA